VTPADTADWVRLRSALWPHHDETHHSRDAADFFAGRSAEPAAVFLARNANGVAIGLVELSIRAFAEGCESRGVGYIEGIYVTPDARRQGVGRALLAAAGIWARGRGCAEIASDTAPENEASSALHATAGYRDIGLVRCWARRLD
jgi:aminoglycoside 6'-N-acetyltransferase I